MKTYRGYRVLDARGTPVAMTVTVDDAASTKFCCGMPLGREVSRQGDLPRWQVCGAGIAPLSQLPVNGGLPMSLPTGGEKTYLEINPAGGGFTIQAERHHAAELRALFEQHGIAYELLRDVQPGCDELGFHRESDVQKAREILDAYKNPTGS
jgi:hypothetical protein